MARTLKEVEKILRDCDEKGMSTQAISKYMNISDHQQFKYRKLVDVYKTKNKNTPIKPIVKDVVIEPKKTQQPIIKPTPIVTVKSTPKKLPEVDTKIVGKTTTFKCPICDSEVKKNNNIFQCTRKGCSYKEVSSGPNHFPLMLDWGMARADYDGITHPQVLSEEFNVEWKNKS